MRTKDAEGNVTDYFAWDGKPEAGIAAGSMTQVYDQPVTVALRGGGSRTHLGGKDGALCGTNVNRSRPAASRHDVDCIKCLKAIEKAPLAEEPKPEPATTKEQTTVNRTFKVKAETVMNGMTGTTTVKVEAESLIQAVDAAVNHLVVTKQAQRVTVLSAEMIRSEPTPAKNYEVLTGANARADVSAGRRMVELTGTGDDGKHRIVVLPEDEARWIGACFATITRAWRQADGEDD